MFELGLHGREAEREGVSHPELSISALQVPGLALGGLHRRRSGGCQAHPRVPGELEPHPQHQRPSLLGSGLNPFSSHVLHPCPRSIWGLSFLLCPRAANHCLPLWWCPRKRIFLVYSQRGGCLCFPSLPNLICLVSCFLSGMFLLSKSSSADANRRSRHDDLLGFSEVPSTVC